MGDIVPENIRGSYFGKRSFILGIVSFLTTFSAGLLLNFLSPTIGTIITFSIMFAIAFLARLGGIYFFTKMEEPELVLKENPRSKDYNFKKFISKITTNEYGVFVMYLCLFGFAVNIASPFFSVYMLKNLHFSYTQFTIIASASIISSFITVLFWGKYSDKYGTKNVMLLTGFLIPLVPLLWIFTTNFKILFIIEMFSGIVWAGFNLSSSNYVYDATDPANRTKNVAYLNILRGLFVFGGAILGGYMTNHLPSLWFASAIPVVFLISFALRLLVTTIFFSKVKEARLVEVRISKSMFHSSIIINPKQAAFQYTHPVKIENTQKTNYCDHNHTQKDNCNYQKIEKTQNQINAEEERKKREEQSIKEGKKWVSQHIKRTQGIDLDQKKTLDNIRKNQGYFDKSNKK
jgi:MFS family permease